MIDRDLNRKEKEYVRKVFDDYASLIEVNARVNYAKLNYFQKLCFNEVKNVLRCSRLIRDKVFNNNIKDLIEIMMRSFLSGKDNRKESIFNKNDIKTLEMFKHGIEEEIRRIKLSEKIKRRRKKSK